MSRPNEAYVLILYKDIVKNAGNYLSMDSPFAKKNHSKITMTMSKVYPFF